MKNKICSIEGCGKKHSAKGFCLNHYMKWVRNAEPEAPEKKCNIDGCNNRIYAKGVCQNHRMLFMRKGNFEHERDKPKKKCDAPDCLNFIGQRTKYCNFHYGRMKNGIPFDIPRGMAFCGERNPRWNGGTSQYKNHSQMKRIRKVILEKANYICSFCGKIANEIHHLDLSKDNHDPSNLVACCRKCNSQYRKKHKIYDCKYRRLYGLSITELVKKGFQTDSLKERLRIGI